MAKKTYMIIKLAPQVASWCDRENNIHLSRPNKTSRRLKDGCDMKMINKGVKAGLIMLIPCEEEIVEDVKPQPQPKKASKKAKSVEHIEVAANVIEEKKAEEVVEEVVKESVEEKKEVKIKTINKED